MEHYKMIAAARKVRGQRQEDLAAALAAETGQDWNRAHIAAIENGRKAFTVETLLLIAKVQDMPLSWYLEPPVGSRASRPYIRIPNFLAPAAA